MINALQFFIYRVSHIKQGNVVMLWWEYRFWFLLICSILRVHEIGTVMPNSSVFFFYVACPLQFDIDIKIQKSRSIFSVKNSLNVPNVKLFSISVSDTFLLKMTPCTSHIEWFPWHQEPQRPQQLQWPQWPQWPQQPHFIKKLAEDDVANNLATKCPILVSQCGMEYQKYTI